MGELPISTVRVSISIVVSAATTSRVSHEWICCARAMWQQLVMAKVMCTF